MNPIYLRWILLVSIIIYFIYDYIDSKNIIDERENLIQLKTYALVQKIVSTVLLILTVLYFFNLSLDAFLVLIVFCIAFLYTEIIGKWYYRKNL